ncbi:DUF4214 domain-containing protein [Phormidium sp. LEGE 05292]|uniref:DUF4214 domain-containing protein n=1 Tax=[Phormidium] sp. LEGE 05292 TaxID=767427 RepID=UPI00187E1ECD|nr:DUF4214 domain-containing protein [Phormidium sp. LEGE 05292]MBE9225935.1 DUF4214 domain-containing protein [Phormidium sp. LEGE 05292]
MKTKSLSNFLMFTSGFLLVSTLANPVQALDCGWQGIFSPILRGNPEAERQSYLGKLSDIEQINEIYIEVLGREVDYPGIVTWTKELDRYRTICEIRRDIAYSREAEAAINQMYQEVLGRNVDKKGLDIWKNVLAKGTSLYRIRLYLEKYREEMEKKFQQEQS